MVTPPTFGVYWRRLSSSPIHPTSEGHWVVHWTLAHTPSKIMFASTPLMQFKVPFHHWYLWYSGVNRLLSTSLKSSQSRFSTNSSFSPLYWVHQVKVCFFKKVTTMVILSSSGARWALKYNSNSTKKSLILCALPIPVKKEGMLILHNLWNGELVLLSFNSLISLACHKEFWQAPSTLYPLSFVYDFDVPLWD